MGSGARRTVSRSVEYLRFATAVCTAWRSPRGPRQRYDREAENAVVITDKSLHEALNSILSLAPQHRCSSAAAQHVW